MGNKLTTSRVRAGGPPHEGGGGGENGGGPNSGGRTVAEKKKLSKIRTKAERSVTWSKSSQAVTWSGPSVTNEASRGREMLVTSRDPFDRDQRSVENSARDVNNAVNVAAKPAINGVDNTTTLNHEGPGVEYDPLGVSASAAPRTSKPDVAMMSVSETSIAVTNHLTLCQECKNSGDSRGTAKGQPFHISSSATTIATATACTTPGPDRTDNDLHSNSIMFGGHSSSLITPTIIVTPGSPEVRPLSPADNNGRVPAGATTSAAQFSFSGANRAAAATSSASSSSSPAEVTTSSSIKVGEGRDLDRVSYGDYSDPGTDDVILRKSPSRSPAQNFIATSVTADQIQTFNKSESRAISSERLSSFDPRYASIQPYSDKSVTGSYITESITKDDDVDSEAIYAIPIPKSQRKPRDSPTNGPDAQFHEDDHYKETFDNFENDSLKGRVQVSCQMKKSTTTGQISTMGYSTTTYRDTFRNDYFSLGRRPKRPRFQTLVDSRGMAVSLDVLLKIRRQNSVDESGISPSTTASEAASVDDILKSCHEFDANAPFVYRSRTSSDGVSRTLRYVLAPAFMNGAGMRHLPKEVHSNDKMTNGYSSRHSTDSSSNVSEKASQANAPREQVSGAAPVAQGDQQTRMDTTDVGDDHVSVTGVDHPMTDNPQTSDCPIPEIISPVKGIVILGNSRLPSRMDTTDAPSTAFVPVAPSNRSKAESTSSASGKVSFTPGTTITAAHPHSVTISAGYISKNAGDGEPTSPPATVPDQRAPLSSSSDTQSDTTSLLSPVSLSSDDGGQCLTNLLSVDTYQEVSSRDASPGRKSPNSYAKLEAVEALKWLRAAGFPQYAQMFDDGQFPVELSFVERDHDFLDADSLKSLFRRLETLNKYAGMKIHSQHKKKGTSEEDDEEEDLCALSERWEYQKSARRWSRKEPQSPRDTVNKPLDDRAGSHDSLLADQDSGSQAGDSPLMDSKQPHSQNAASGDGLARGLSPATAGDHVSVREAGDADQMGQQHTASFSPPLRRTASEKVKPTRTLWKSMKSKKRSGGGGQRGIVEISNPVVADKENMQAKLLKFNCRDISPTCDSATALPLPGKDRVQSPTTPQSAPASVAALASSFDSPFDSPFGSRKTFATQSLRAQHPPAHTADQTDSGRGVGAPAAVAAANDSHLREFYSAHTKLLQSLESAQLRETGVVKLNKNDNNLQEIFILPEGHQPGKFPTVLQNGYIETKSSAPQVPPEPAQDIQPHADHDPIAPTSADYASGKRFSFYDNWLPAADNKTDHGASQAEDSLPSGSNHLTTGSLHVPLREGHGHTLDSIRESRSSSVLSNSESQSDTDSRQFTNHSRDPGPSSHSLTTFLPNRTDRRTSSSRESSAEPTSSGRITQSPSLQSGDLTETSSLHSTLMTDSAEVSGNIPNLKMEYEEFDLILQQLYHKIQDLNSYVTDEEKGSSSTQSSVQHPATTPAPQRVLTVDMPSSQQTPFQLDSPVSPTSDLVVSPVSGLDVAGDESVEESSSSSSGSSGGDSSQSGSDQEVGLTDLSHDDSLDQISHVSMERRDSGVGHSLTRASGDRRRKKLRWNSFQKCHRPDVTCRAMQINSLTVSQLVRLQKLSLLKLTSIMEKYLPANKSGWNWMMAKLMKKKPPDFNDKNVFGVPFTVMAQRTGQPLPQCVLYAMRYLRRTSQNAVGIFRKSGVKSKIQQLRDHLEAHPETSDFEDANAYNVADMLKTYFRDLPECLLTNKMSETFRSIYTYVPQPQRLEAIQAAILLLPDENREVLQSILLFLSDISSHEADHQMNASNLAVCFTPTVFQLGSRYTGAHSPKRNRKNSPGIPDPREILEQKAAHECLLMMISECKKLFTIPSSTFRQLQGPSLAHLEPAPLQDIGNSPAEVKAFGQERIQMVLKEAHDKNRGWTPAAVINDVEVFHRKPMDDCPLKEWKFVVEIEAPPVEVLRRIMHERHTWDEDLLSWSVLERLDPHSDIFQYVLSSMAPHPSRHYCVLRYWRSDLNKGACALVTMSVEHSENMDIQGVWAIDLGSYILMEPCGSGRSRMTYITRVDTRGRSPEWYSKVFGHVCANFLERLQESFKQESGGPETKV